VIFASDNGPQFSVTWTDRTGLTRYNCGLSGHKDLVYEGGIRVPAILRWPGGGLIRGESHRLAHFCDWFPTLLDVAGVSVPKELALDGRSLLPVLRGQRDACPPSRFWQFSRYQSLAQHNAAMRQGDWKLVRPAPPHDVTGSIFGVLKPDGIVEPPAALDRTARYLPKVPAPLPPQLFNLRQDPQEMNDLSAREPERTRQMGAELDQWFESVMRDYHAAETRKGEYVPFRPSRSASDINKE
jgi:arylsulfatase A